MKRLIEGSGSVIVHADGTFKYWLPFDLHKERGGKAMEIVETRISSVGGFKLYMVEFVTEGEEKITVKVENETEAELARDEVLRRAAIKLGEALGVACMECGIPPESLLTRPSARRAGDRAELER